MKVIILYRPQSEHGRLVDVFVRELQQRHGLAKLELVNIDTREGAAMASLYDVMQYPGLLVVREDGSLLRSWEGAELPLVDEVAYYADQPA